jgi:RHS repeat-associated protein
VLIAENRYDELGQLIEKQVHSGIQSIDFRYNIRGWLTNINNAALSNDGTLNNDSNDLFGMELAYNAAVSGLSSSVDAQYNGNISAVQWKRKDQSNTQGYLFNYDALNRLKKADYKYRSSSWVNSSNYDVYGNHSGKIGYDLNGNIMSLVRKNGSGTTIDNLSYAYNGNQLKSVEDAAGNDGFKELVSNPTEYVFDDNGNLIDDDNRGHVIQYNLLNLPKNLNSGTLRYEYSAAGEKLKKIFNNTTTTDYIGNFVYNGSSLAYIITSEGRIVKPGSTYEYEYNLKDHLGNTRVSFHASQGTPIVKQYQDYYPFGMAMGLLQGDNRYLYNGKELQTETVNGDNLDWLDYGARFLDPALGRWHVIDNKAEKYLKVSPYNYALNNPILFLDPDGNDVKVSTTQNKKTGRTVVTFNVTMSIKNSSRFSKTVVGKRAISVKNQIEQSYSGYNSKSNTEYRTVVTFDKKETDYVLDFVDEVEGGSSKYSAGKVDEIGNSIKNRMQVQLSKGADGEPLDSEQETSRTGAHEYGHTLGLRHGGTDGSLLDSSSEENLMNQSGTDMTSTKINNDQLSKAQKSVENDQRVKNNLEEKNVKNQY